MVGGAQPSDCARIAKPQRRRHWRAGLAGEWRPPHFRGLMMVDPSCRTEMSSFSEWYVRWARRQRQAAPGGATLRVSSTRASPCHAPHVPLSPVHTRPVPRFGPSHTHRVALIGTLSSRRTLHPPGQSLRGETSPPRQPIPRPTPATGARSTPIRHSLQLYANPFPRRRRTSPNKAGDSTGDSCLAPGDPRAALASRISARLDRTAAAWMLPYRAPSGDEDAVGDWSLLR